jgi:hypothetical protein
MLPSSPKTLSNRQKGKGENQELVDRGKRRNYEYESLKDFRNHFHMKFRFGINILKILTDP